MEQSQLLFNNPIVPPAINAELESICADVQKDRLSASLKQSICERIMTLYTNHLCPLSTNLSSFNNQHISQSSQTSVITMDQPSAMETTSDQEANNNNIANQQVPSVMPAVHNVSQMCTCQHQTTAQPPPLKKVLFIIPKNITREQAIDLVRLTVPGGKARTVAIRGTDPQNIVIETCQITVEKIRSIYPTGSFNLGEGFYKWILNPSHTPCSKCGRGNLCQLEGTETICGKCIRQQAPPQQNTQSQQLSQRQQNPQRQQLSQWQQNPQRQQQPSKRQQQPSQRQQQPPQRQQQPSQRQNGRNRNNSHQWHPPPTNYGRPGSSGGHGSRDRDQRFYHHPNHHSNQRFIPPRMRNRDWWPDYSECQRRSFHPRDRWDEPPRDRYSSRPPWFSKYNRY